MVASALFETTVSGWSEVALLGAMGLALGIVSGLFGVGGGFLSTPLLNIFFRKDYPLAIGTTLSFILGTSAVGAASHWRLGNVNLKAVALIAVGSMAGVLAGDAVLHVMQAQFDQEYTNVMHVLFIVLLMAVALRISRGQVTNKDRDGLLKRLPIGPRVDLGSDRHLKRLSAPGLAGVGFCGGMLTGGMGIGGGVLIVPILVLTVGLPVHQAIGTSLGVLLLSAAVAVVKKGWVGEVDLGIGMSLLIGSSIGAQIGVSICNRLHAHRLRRYFAYLVCLVAAMIAAKLAGLIPGPGAS